VQVVLRAAAPSSAKCKQGVKRNLIAELELEESVMVLPAANTSKSRSGGAGSSGGNTKGASAMNIGAVAVKGPAALLSKKEAAIAAKKGHIAGSQLRTQTVRGFMNVRSTLPNAVHKAKQLLGSLSDEDKRHPCLVVLERRLQVAEQFLNSPKPNQEDPESEAWKQKVRAMLDQDEHFTEVLAAEPIVLMSLPELEFFREVGSKLLQTGEAVLAKFREHDAALQLISKVIKAMNVEMDNYTAAALADKKAKEEEEKAMLREEKRLELAAQREAKKAAKEEDA
jgi:hypothetical protein